MMAIGPPNDRNAEIEGVDTPSLAPALAMLPYSTTVKNTDRSRSRSRRPIWSCHWTSLAIKHLLNTYNDILEFP
jgi:hypothetical protein